MSPLYQLSLLAAMTSAATIKNEAHDTSWCTFWTEDICSVRSGHVDYDVSNPGIFRNGGSYLKCRSEDEFTLISYPPGDDEGLIPNHCHTFAAPDADDICNHLDDFGFTKGDGGYYRFSLDTICPEITGRSVDSNTTKRDANYLGFYNDPECDNQSDSVHYSTSNQGCFENAGAYATFPGDDYDWHIEQFPNTGNEWCTDYVEHCVTSEAFLPGPGGNPCVHLDDAGLSSVFGSYRIARGGSP